MCVAVVQWSRTCLHVHTFLCTVFFFPVRSLFLTLFFLLAFFSLFLLLTLLVEHLDQYIFQAEVRSFILAKGFEKLIDLNTCQAYDQIKTIGCQDIPPLKQLNFYFFFNVS